MGNPKQKWTTEEEDALRAGVNKHGTGKWKDIQRDPEFNQHLFSRSNIDLKDKWRNMVGGGSGQSARDKSRTGKAKPNLDSPSASAQLPNVAAVEDDAAADASNKASDEGKSVTLNNTWIFEALAFLKEPNPNGVDLGVIFNYIEQRYGVPQNFRRLLSSRLRRLVSQDKLERGSNGYKLKSDSSSSSVATVTPTVTERDIKPRHFLQGTTTAPITAAAIATTTFGESIEDAAVEAAYKIADAENKAFIAADKVETAERVSKMAEDADAMLLFAQDILYRCSEGDLVFVA